MPFDTPKDWLLKHADDEKNGIISVGGFVIRNQRNRHPLSQLQALSKLLDFQRRRMGLSLHELAQRVQLPLVNLHGILNGTDPLPTEAIPALSYSLQLPEEKLRQLCNVSSQPDAKLEEAAIRFIEKCASVQTLTNEEKAALDEFVQVLSS